MSAGPLVRVLDAIGAGAASYGDIEEATGLTREVVTASVDHLVRMGRLRAQALTVGCPGGGCGSCASGAGGDQPGCGAAGPSAARRGAALVTLSLAGGVRS